MSKTKDSTKAMLREQWEQACNGYTMALLRMWELDAYYGYWIGEEIGGVYDYGGGMFTIGMDDTTTDSRNLAATEEGVTHMTAIHRHIREVHTTVVDIATAENAATFVQCAQQSVVPRFVVDLLLIVIVTVIVLAFTGYDFVFDIFKGLVSGF